MSDQIRDTTTYEEFVEQVDIVVQRSQPEERDQQLPVIEVRNEETFDS